MNFTQITDLHELFISAMSDWDVTVQIDVTGDGIEVGFQLWRIDFDLQIEYDKGEWKWADEQTPWPLKTHADVWKVIAAELSNRITLQQS